MPAASPRPSAPSSPIASRQSASPFPAGPSNPRPVSSRPSQPKPPTPPTQTQPTHVRLCPAGLRSLPYRLTHPPAIPPDLHAEQQTTPAPSADPKGKGKAHWWSLDHWGIRIQPHYEVSLEDVLNRKHLPPLGLKDFEEWLLFVEGTAENLYFILWLRDYTARYDAWMSSLKNLKRSPSNAASHHAGITFNLAPQAAHAPQPHRPYASLGLALSTLSLPAPTGNPSQPGSPTARRGSHASIYPPDGYPPRPADDALAERPSERQLRPYAPSPPPLPPPNPGLAFFYIRAKETFLAPDAPYELDVGSEVLGSFFVGSDTKHRREEDTSPYGPLRNLSSINLSAKAGLGGKLPPPPDPAVFAELKEIVEGRLKKSLARLVVATYHNVGMSRAYCGNAGGVVIGTVTSAPPLIASFTLGASRWYRLFALPGMWLGMTIFISACYGVCMMIYVFGDLRQLRSFELVRPTISKPKSLPAPRDDAPASPVSGSPITFNNPFPSSPFPQPLAATSTATMSRKMSLPATSASAGEPSRKMSLPAKLSGLVINRSRERVVPPRVVEEERLREAITPLTRPPVLAAPSRRSSVAERRASMSIGSRPPVLTINVVPPEPVYARVGRERMPHEREEVGPLDPLPAEEEDEEEGYTSEESFSDEDESEPEDEDQPAGDTQSKKKRRHRRRHSQPIIEISDALYDEDPSPEGPATAPAVWTPGALERRSAAAALAPTPDSRRASIVPGSTTPANPLWPDYEGSEGAHAPAPEDQTAVFIRPFAYDAAASGVHAVGREGERSADVERVLSASPAPAEEFDFDGLPPRAAEPTAEDEEEDEEELAYRPASPAPSAATRSEAGSAIDHRGRCWLVRRWWVIVEALQRRCSPENVVEVLRRKSDESLRDDKGKARESTTAAAPVPAEPAQQQVTASEKARRARQAEKQARRAKAAQRRRTRTVLRGLGLRKMYLSVPAFAAPLTPVLNPLVGRAQWEIVVRSAAMAAVVSVVVVGGLVGVPE